VDPAAKDELGGLWMGSTGLYPGFLFFLFFPIDLPRRALGPPRLTTINGDLSFEAVSLPASVK
jgi:hypothetical protein